MCFIAIIQKIEEEKNKEYIDNHPERYSTPEDAYWNGLHKAIQIIKEFDISEKLIEPTKEAKEKMKAIGIEFK
jgi:hypothetical protein